MWLALGQAAVLAPALRVMFLSDGATERSQPEHVRVWACAKALLHFTQLVGASFDFIV